MAVLSPELISDISSDGTNRVINISILRAKVLRVMENIDPDPQSPLGRSGPDRARGALPQRHQPAADRDRPLPPGAAAQPHAAASGLDQRAETLRFFETQLAYDERQLDAQEREAATAQEALSMFVSGKATEVIGRPRPMPPARGRRPPRRLRRRRR